MKRFIFIGLLAAGAIACSLQEELADTFIPRNQVFHARLEAPASDETRVFVDDNLRILWNADDRVSIFNKYTYNQEYRFMGETGDNAGSFKKVENDDFVTGNALDYVYAVYPYRESSRIDNVGNLSVTLPAEQPYRADSFGPGVNAMVSCTSGNELLFKNLCGYIMLKLYGEDERVTSISLKGNNGEPLAGPASVQASENEIPTMSFGSGTTPEITLTFDNPVTLGTTAEMATVFWLVVPPTTFSSGITLTVQGEGGVFEKSTTKSLTITRNRLERMAALKVSLKGEGITATKYLTFTSEGTTTISLTNYEDNAPVLYYSRDKTNWSLWDYSELSFTNGAPLYICGDNPEGFGRSKSKRSTFTTSGDSFGVSGDVMSLINKDEKVTVIPCEGCFSALFYQCGQIVSAPTLPATTLTDYCYYCMFYSCTNLTKAPELPATTLANYCYANMFRGCTSLTAAPELPAATLAECCYQYMFLNCSSLTIAPELPATTLAEASYDCMFQSCTSLTTAPKLPATTLALFCYHGMFNRCTNLKVAPKLPATTLAQQCYESMFQNCTNLTTPPELPATTLAKGCYMNMFANCTSLTTAPELPAPVLSDGCYDCMFHSCSNLNYVKCLATNISASVCVHYWLYGVASSGTFVKAPGMNNWPNGVSGIPVGWAVKNAN